MSTVDSNGPHRSSSAKEDGLAQLSRSVENAKRIKNVQDKFVNSQNLQKEGRALVGEGILMKVCRKKTKQRAFFLFNDILVYGRVVISGRKYSQQKIIPLSEIQIGDSVDSAENPYAWLIRSRKKSFTVRANSDRERQEWLTHLERCIRHARGGNNINEGLAASWIPDYKAVTCMHCHSTKFSTYNRRHHCRNCGLVVCDGCSKKRFVILNLDSKAVRVCDSCYTKLSNNNGTNDSHSNQRDRTADSSDSDGDESIQPDSPVPATFYHNVENFS